MTQHSAHAAATYAAMKEISNQIEVVSVNKHSACCTCSVTKISMVSVRAAAAVSGVFLMASSSMKRLEQFELLQLNTQQWEIICLFQAPRLFSFFLNNVINSE